MAGNQLGKTLAGGFEVAMHATGRYPDWWSGRRFDRPTVGWACGITGEGCAGHRAERSSRPPRTRGDRRNSKGRPCRARTGARHFGLARHHQGASRLWRCLSYRTENLRRGREKFQGETLDLVWFDEEPPADIYTEGLTRTNVGANPVWMTLRRCLECLRWCGDF
jgi:phage terminase large subunit-like protein